MAAVVPDLDGLELVGDHAEAVLIGGCDETVEPNQVFSYMNLARAFAEIQMGAALVLPAQEQVVADEHRADARLGRLRRRARVRGRGRGDGARQAQPGYFAAALDALDAEPELTWLVTDDVEADVRGARLSG